MSITLHRASDFLEPGDVFEVTDAEGGEEQEVYLLQAIEGYRVDLMRLGSEKRGSISVGQMPGPDKTRRWFRVEGYGSRPSSSWLSQAHQDLQNGFEFARNARGKGCEIRFNPRTREEDGFISAWHMPTQDGLIASAEFRAGDENGPILRFYPYDLGLIPEDAVAERNELGRPITYHTGSTEGMRLTAETAAIGDQKLANYGLMKELQYHIGRPILSGTTSNPNATQRIEGKFADREHPNRPAKFSGFEEAWGAYQALLRRTSQL